MFRGGTFVQEFADALLSTNGVEDVDAAFARRKRPATWSRLALATTRALHPLDDVEVQLPFGMRIRDYKRISAYTWASGKAFRSLMDEINWNSS